MLHFTGHFSLSRFHCHTEFVMKFSKQSASKRNVAKVLLIWKHHIPEQNQITSLLIKRTYNIMADSWFKYLNTMVLIIYLDAGKSFLPKWKQAAILCSINEAHGSQHPSPQSPHLVSIVLNRSPSGRICALAECTKTTQNRYSFSK